MALCGLAVLWFSSSCFNNKCVCCHVQVTVSKQEVGFDLDGLETAGRLAIDSGVAASDDESERDADSDSSSADDSSSSDSDDDSDATSSSSEITPSSGDESEVGSWSTVSVTSEDSNPEAESRVGGRVPEDSGLDVPENSDADKNDDVVENSVIENVSVIDKVEDRLDEQFECLTVDDEEQVKVEFKTSADSTDDCDSTAELAT